MIPATLERSTKHGVGTKSVYVSRNAVINNTYATSDPAPGIIEVSNSAAAIPAKSFG